LGIRAVSIDCAGLRKGVVLADVLVVAELGFSTVCVRETGCRWVVLADILVVAELELGAVGVGCALQGVVFADVLVVADLVRVTVLICFADCGTGWRNSADTNLQEADLSFRAFRIKLAPEPGTVLADV
jgi:hypothetical protein